jgi:2-dehydro-3-deoxyphosphogluconate aldolase / (4S)-4-hydroxy-2-oxoglutarate aldolase
MEARIAAIIRSDDLRAAEAATSALAEAGIRALEFSLTGTAALDAIGRVRAAGPGLMVGAGTVRTADDAQRAVAAGAEWLVSPSLAPEVHAWALAHDILHVPGAFSPTEVAAADEAGARLIKLFPARALGPRYVQDLLAPFPRVRLVATGGIDEHNASAFLAAGAVAVGVGGPLNAPDAASAPHRVRAAAERLRAAVEESAQD